MYRAYFNFTDTPFKKSIPIEKYFISAALTELFARFDFMKANHGIMLLTGESGTGKTTAIRHLMETINKSYFLPVYIQLATVTPIEFYRQINTALGGGHTFRKCDVFASIQKLILDYAITKNHIPVIVLDEAHYLKNDVFIELQLLLNFNIDSLDPAVFILAGLPYLCSRLAANVFTPLYNRINLSYTLSALTKSETMEYIRHNLSIAGGDINIFNTNALNSIYNVSNGNMRLINKLAFDAILFAAQNKIAVIDENIIFKISDKSR